LRLTRLRTRKPREGAPAPHCSTQNVAILAHFNIELLAVFRV
jgi:hypothetical protein